MVATERRLANQRAKLLERVFILRKQPVKLFHELTCLIKHLLALLLSGHVSAADELC